MTEHENEAGRPVDADQAAQPTPDHDGQAHDQGGSEAVLGDGPADPQVFGEQPTGSGDAETQQTGDQQPGDQQAGEEPVELSGPPSQRLAQLGITLPDVPAPVAAYVPAVRTGDLVHTSGQLPFVDGRLTTTGVVGDQAVDVTADEAAVLARQCALNAVAAVASLVDLDSVVRVVKVTGFVASAPGFGGQPVVVNGASELLGQVFGDAGRHARSAVGVAALPLGAPVEVEIVVEVR